MKQIISASRRTDIPAFYSEWFMDCIRQGYCHVPNPMYPLQKTKPISLKAEDVEIIVFWTRDPAPLMKYLPELDKRGYKYYFQYTIIGYPREIEPGSPSIEDAIAAFKKLSDSVGKERVVWRYDPILFSNITPYEWHIRQMSRISDELSDYTGQLVISFIDGYRKTALRMKKETGDKFELHKDAFDAAVYRDLARWIGRAMSAKNIEAVTCAEKIDLKDCGIEHGRCINDKLISKVLCYKISGVKDKAQREACGCVRSRDIGTNNTCLFGCKYCYANNRSSCLIKKEEKTYGISR